MYQTKVVHCKKEPYDVYIGRPSPWGNPFVVGRYGNRETVCIKFKAWMITGKTFGCIEATESKRQWILNHLEELRGKVIACWCAPKDCHGNVYDELLTDRQSGV